MRLYSLISIMHAQFGTPTSIKNSKQSYKLFKTNVYVSAFNQIIKPVGITEFKQINQLPVNYRFRQCLTAKRDIFDKSCIGQASTREYYETKSTTKDNQLWSALYISFLAPSIWNNLEQFAEGIKTLCQLDALKAKCSVF